MHIPDFSLKGAVALITGGRRGIGKAIALAFAEAGADVAVCDIVIEDGELEKVAEEIRGFGRRSLALQADTTVKADVENMVRKITDQFGAVDILLNNAGVNVTKPIIDLSEDEWDRVVDVDLKGYFLCAQVVGRKMIERKKGTIINIASQFAFKAVPKVGVYSIAKAGVVMLTRVLAREWGQHNVRANAIAPGMVKTEFNRHIWSDDSFMAQQLASIPLGQVAETGDLIGTSLYLACAASAHVSGHTIIVDGGGIA